MTTETLKHYQCEFIDFLIEAEALTFGDFVTKSGRKTPYFVNTGKFNSGERIARLGEFYSRHIHAHGLDDVDVIFGPAYKGIPLAVATSIALAQTYGSECSYAFDRKEAKTHGDKGAIVGASFSDNDTIIIVEDVITAGTTLKAIIPTLRQLARLDFRGVVVSVDRCERGASELSALRETEAEVGVPIFPIVSIYDILTHLTGSNASGVVLSDAQQTAIRAYLAEYGARQ